MLASGYAKVTGDIRIVKENHSLFASLCLIILVSAKTGE
jgi:hypothetical protein